MEDARATATTIAPLFAPILQITVVVVRVHKDVTLNAPSRVGQDALHNVLNHVALDAPPNAPSRVGRDVIRLVLQDVQTIVPAIATIHV